MNKRLQSRIKDREIMLLYLTKFQNGFHHFCFIYVLHTDRGQSRSQRNRHGCSGVAVLFVTRVSIATVAIPITPPRVEYTALVLALQFTIFVSYFPQTKGELLFYIESYIFRSSSSARFVKWALILVIHFGQANCSTLTLGIYIKLFLFFYNSSQNVWVI